jgi:hypothetical protein
MRKKKEEEQKKKELYSSSQKPLIKVLKISAPSTHFFIKMFKSVCMKKGRIDSLIEKTFFMCLSFYRFSLLLSNLKSVLFYFFFIHTFKGCHLIVVWRFCIRKWMIIFFFLPFSYPLFFPFICKSLKIFDDVAIFSLFFYYHTYAFRSILPFTFNSFFCHCFLDSINKYSSV